MLILIGLNHKTASIELREKLAFSDEQSLSLLELFKNETDIDELILFSTCNRTEILYAHAVKNSFLEDDFDQSDSLSKKPFYSDEQGDKIINFFSRHNNVDSVQLKKSLYVYKNEDAVRHLFKVTASLDSMVIGEPQILGQIKKAYRMAVEKNTTKVILNKLMHKAFSTAKKIRKETEIGNNAVSIGYAAVELAKKIFSDLSKKTVLLLGAGEISELSVEHLIANKAKNILVANRTFKNAVALATKFSGQAIRFEERQDVLINVDIIISSTSSKDYILTYDDVKTIMKKRKHKMLFFIDVAVPRNIDPEINNLANSYVYDIDDLDNIIQSNMEQRKSEIIKAQRFIEEAVVQFNKWLGDLAIVPTIKAINAKMTAIAKIECDKTLLNLEHLSIEDIKAIKRMVKAITTRTTHDPIIFLRNIGTHRKDSFYLNAARQLFNLDISKE